MSTLFVLNGPNLNLLGTREPAVYGRHTLADVEALCAAACENAGAYTHTSIALHDAIKGTGVPLIELHISNVFAREAFRHHSTISPVARAVICGLGVDGYPLAIQALARMQTQA